MSLFANCLIKSKVLIVVIVDICMAFFIFAPQIHAQGLKNAVDGLDKTATEGYGDLGGIPKNVPEAIGKVIGALLAFVGVLFLVLMIYGGFTWMTARGNDQEVSKAKDLITSAVIGLIIVLAAYAITAYIGEFITTSG
jgi:hypothetical protein